MNIENIKNKIKYVGFIKNMDTNYINYWNKISNSEIEREYMLEIENGKLMLDINFHLSDLEFFHGEKNENYMFVLDDENNIYYIQILKVHMKTYVSDRDPYVNYRIEIEDEVYKEKNFKFMHKPSVKLKIKNTQNNMKYPNEIDLLKKESFDMSIYEFVLSKSNRL